MNHRPTILVTGDVTMEWNIAVEDNEKPVQNVAAFHGGAVRVQKLLHACAAMLQAKAKDHAPLVMGKYFRYKRTGNVANAAGKDKNGKNPPEWVDVIEETKLAEVAIDAQAYVRFEEHPAPEEDKRTPKPDKKLLSSRKKAIESWPPQKWPPEENSPHNLPFYDKVKGYVENHPDRNGSTDFSKRIEAWRDSRGKKFVWRAMDPHSLSVTDPEEGSDAPPSWSPTSQYRLPEPETELTAKLEDPAFRPDVTVIYEQNARFLERQGMAQTWVAPKRALVVNIEYREATSQHVVNGKGDTLENYLTWAKGVGKADYSRVVMLSAADLLRAGIPLSLKTSWEQVCEDLWLALRGRRRLQELLLAADYLIVVFPYAGAMIVETKDGAFENMRPHLVFDPSTQWQRWETNYRGWVHGYTAVMTASVALECAKPGKHLGFKSLCDAVKTGLTISRYLRIAGYRDTWPAVPGKISLEFPYLDLGTGYRYLLNSDRERWKSAFQHQSLNTNKLEEASRKDSRASWSLLELKAREGRTRDLAKIIVKSGADKALDVPVPVIRFNGDEGIILLDRQEIEHYSSVFNAIEEYCVSPDQKTPLPIGVFGKPGAGKSFGMEQIAKHISEAQNTATKIEILTFNLTQMSDKRDLVHAFHRVRDHAIKGMPNTIPMVLWDEFDCTAGSQEFFWLKYFLNPLQDGTFFDEHNTHPLGRAIFVFMGGIFDTYHKLKGVADTALDKTSTQVEMLPNRKAELKAAKFPDFAQRLTLHVNVRSLNPEDGHSSAADLLRIKVKRAAHLHGWLKKNRGKLLWDEVNKELQVSDGVIDAFLDVKEFEYDARSLTKVLEICRLNHATRFDATCLPPEEYLRIHVGDGRQFLETAAKAGA